MVVNSSQGTAGSNDGGAANSDAPIVSGAKGDMGFSAANEAVDGSPDIS